MKHLRIGLYGGIAAMLCIAGATAIGTAQPEHRRDDDRRQDAREERREYPDQRRSAREAREWQRHRGWVKNGDAWQGGDDWDRHRAEQFERQRRTWSQRGGYGGAYIPRDRFQRQFGSQHTFRIRSRPVVVNGYPRFRYGGYQFMMVDPWPERWASDWYATDDVYVDYDDGYYLYNRRDPRFRIALSIVL